MLLQKKIKTSAFSFKTCTVLFMQWWMRRRKTTEDAMAVHFVLRLLGPQTWTTVVINLVLTRPGNRSTLRIGQTIRTTFFVNFLQPFCPKGISPTRNSDCFLGESQLRQSRATKPTVHAGCFSVSIIHRTLTWTTGSLMYTQMLMHVIAHGGVRTP